MRNPGRRRRLWSRYRQLSGHGENWEMSRSLAPGGGRGAGAVRPPRWGTALSLPRRLGYSLPAALCGPPHWLRPVTAAATGCTLVTGLGPVRWMPDLHGFWRVLGKAAGLG